MRLPPAVAALAALIISLAAAQMNTTTTKSQCVEGYNPCPGIGEPYSMCCPIGSTCVALAGSTTKLCCKPEQNGCIDIAPITCNLTLQNATLFGKSMLSSTLIDYGLELPTCNLFRPKDANKDPELGCCPWGYLCDPGSGGKRCRKQVDQVNWRTNGALELSPSQSSEFAAKLATKTDLGPGYSITATAGLQDPPGDADLSDNSGKFPLSTVLAGLFGGLALGAIITIILGCCIGSRVNKRKGRQSGSEEIKQKIGLPMTDKGFLGRAEFTSQYTPSRDGTPNLSKPENLIKATSRRLSRSVRAKSHAAAKGLGISLRDPEAAQPMSSIEEVPPNTPPKDVPPKDYYGTSVSPMPFLQVESRSGRSSLHGSPLMSPDERYILGEYPSDDEGSRFPRPASNRDTVASVYSESGGIRQTVYGAYAPKPRPASFVGNGGALAGERMSTNRPTLSRAYNDLDRELGFSDRRVEDDISEEEEELDERAVNARPNTQFPGGLLPATKYEPPVPSVRRLA